MEFTYLSEAVKIKKTSENDTQGTFEVEGLYTGYGLTIGNALRRVLLSSIPGAAITKIKIKGVGHEFATLPNVIEDVVEIGMNLKKVRFRLHTNETQILTLKKKGEGKVTAADIELNSEIELINPDAHIATLTAKGADLDIELTVEKGLGYVPVDVRTGEKLPIGVVALDAIFSPVVKVNFSVENMRVGERTDYHRIKLFIETDGSITPSAVLRKASKILQDHFLKISEVEVKEAEPIAAEAPKEAKKKAAKAKKTSKKAK
ncbi:MAG: DNA-directed RNA polymerase subunit alpha [Patescibacteria group bacterium]